MADYTAMGFEQITPGTQAGLWGNTTNNNLNLIDQAITGVTPIDLTGASGTVVTLTLIDGSITSTGRSAVLNITGIATGANTVVVPNKQKTYLVRNNTGQNIVFRTASPVATYTVEAGNSILIFCDGNNGVFTGIQSPSAGTLSVSAGGTGSTTFTAGFVKSTGGTNALTSVPNIALASADVSGTLPVANGGTGVTSAGTAGNALISNGAAFISSPTVNSITAGTGISITGSAGSFTISASAASGVTSFNSRTGAISLLSSDVTGALGYTPVSSSALSSYALLSGATFSGGISASSVGLNGSGLGYSAMIGSSLQMFNQSTSVYSNGSQVGFIQNGFGTLVSFANGNLDITGSTATKPSGTTWANPSDIRLKTDIQDYTDGLNKLLQVNPKTWTYNGLGRTIKGLPGIGVIADEVESVLPKTVTTYSEKLNESDANPTDIKKFDATEITWLLVNAVKELKAELDAAKTEIAALKVQ